MRRRLAESLDDRRSLIATLNDIGRLSLSRGIGSGHHLARAGGRHGSGTGGADLLLESVIALGAAQHQAGQIHEAEQRYQEALEWAQQQGDQSAEATLRNNLGLLRQAKGDLEEAAHLFRQAMVFNQAVGNLASKPAIM